MSRGLIVGIGQRGFRVAEVIREDLADITCMRTAVGKAATVQNLSAAIKYSPTGRWHGTSQAQKKCWRNTCARLSISFIRPAAGVIDDSP
jgi:hypothetical protein